MPFNIGFPEMMIIIIIALIVFGPAKLPELGSTVGKAMREFRRASSELTEELTREVDVKKEQERRSASAAVPAPAEPYAPAQTQAYSEEPAVVSSEPLLGAPADVAEAVAQPVGQAASDEPKQG